MRRMGIGNVNKTVYQGRQTRDITEIYQQCQCVRGVVIKINRLHAQDFQTSILSHDNYPDYILTPGAESRQHLH